MSTKVLVGIVFTIIIIGFSWSMARTKTSNVENIPNTTVKNSQSQTEGMMIEGTAKEDLDNDMIGSTSSPTVSGSSTNNSSGAVMVEGGLYEPYAPGRLARAESGSVVLFFKATWCPSCKTVDADIKANLAKIPSNMTILEVNYDTAIDLKKKYGVTYQHTFVQVDAKGTLITKWSGSPTLADIITRVK